jgi:hypothetical protein
MNVTAVTDRHVTVTSNFASVTVAKPCSVRTYELTVTYRHDNPNIYAGAHTRTRTGIAQVAMATVVTVCDGSQPFEAVSSPRICRIVMKSNESTPTRRRAGLHLAIHNPLTA